MMELSNRMRNENWPMDLAIRMSVFLLKLLSLRSLMKKEIVEWLSTSPALAMEF